MSDRSAVPAKAGRFIAAFVVGAASIYGFFALFAYIMVQQGHMLSFAWHLAAAAVCMGSALSGWLYAFLQKQHGFVCGTIQGIAFAGTLLMLQILNGSVPQGRSFVELILIIITGMLGGLIYAFNASRARNR